MMTHKPDEHSTTPQTASSGKSARIAYRQSEALKAAVDKLKASIPGERTNSEICVGALQLACRLRGATSQGKQLVFIHHGKREAYNFSFTNCVWEEQDQTVQGHVEKAVVWQHLMETVKLYKSLDLRISHSAVIRDALTLLTTVLPALQRGFMLQASGPQVAGESSQLKIAFHESLLFYDLPDRQSMGELIGRVTEASRYVSGLFDSETRELFKQKFNIEPRSFPELTRNHSSVLSQLVRN